MSQSQDVYLSANFGLGYCKFCGQERELRLGACFECVFCKFCIHQKPEHDLCLERVGKPCE